MCKYQFSQGWNDILLVFASRIEFLSSRLKKMIFYVGIEDFRSKDADWSFFDLDSHFNEDRFNKSVHTSDIPSTWSLFRNVI